jgi:membrane-associated phospholipid phosphatase
VPLALDLILAAFAGVLAVLATRWYLRSPLPDDPALEVAETIGDSVRRDSRLRRLVASRLDRSVATGLLLTTAFAIVLLGGGMLGLLAFLVRRSAGVQHLDNGIADFGSAHRSGISTSGLQAVTQLGNIRVVIVLAVVLAVADAIRTRGRWTAILLVVVLGGMEGISTGVKYLVDRARPTLNPDAAALGPSFPSGHSATAAAFYAAAVLVLSRWSVGSAITRQVLVGGAVALAVAVAGSRVLLDVHWLSDVLGGLALGWGWFMLVAIVFGGRLLRPTAVADAVRAKPVAGGGAPACRESPSRRR